MRLLSYDFETTGLDHNTDRITEIGAVLWDVPTQKPLLIKGIFLHDDTYPALSDDIQRITGLTDGILREFGVPPARGIGELEDLCTKHEVRYLLGHNSENFDRPFLLNEIARSGICAPRLQSLPGIDTRHDLPFAVEPDSRKLKHLALDAGFINPFPHRAVFDALTTLRVLQGFPLDSVLEYQKIPFVVCRAMVTFETKELAKARRYSWEKIGDKVYPRQWIKKIKANQLEREQTEACFPVVQIE